MSGDMSADADLDIVAESFRMVSDVEAFDAMIAAWHRKLTAENSDEPLPTGSALFRHLGVLRDLFERTPVKIAEDPVEALVRDNNRPVFVLEADGLVVAANQTARSVFKLRQGGRTSFAWLSPASREDYSALKRSALERGNRKQAILRLTLDEQDHDLAEAFVMPSPPGTPAKIAVRGLTLPWTIAIESQLADAFDLTQAEIDICRLMLETRDTTEIARRRGASVRTVRTQLGTVFSKTGATSQVDLIRLLALMAAHADTDEQDALQAWADPFGREKLIRGARGNTIAYSWMGNPEGQPVLLLHGPAIGYALLPEADDLLRRLGLYVICMQRPGHGRTDLITDLDPLAANVECIANLLDHLGLETVYGVGIMMPGGFSLLEFASQYPDRLKGLTVMTGATFLNEASFLKSAPMVQRTLFHLTKTAPWAVHLIAAAGIRAMRTKGVDWYLSRAYAQSPFDLDSLSRPEVLTLLRNACAMMLAQGPRGFSDDLFFVQMRGRPYLERLDLPISWVHGEHDRFCPPEAVAEICAKYPKLDVARLPDCGELAYYQDWEATIRAIHGHIASL